MEDRKDELMRQAMLDINCFIVLFKDMVNACSEYDEHADEYYAMLEWLDKELRPLIVPRALTPYRRLVEYVNDDTNMPKLNNDDGE